MSTRTSSGSTTSGSKQQQTAQPTQTSLPHDKIAMLAYQKWVKRGCPHGTDRQDWLDAEAELKAAVSKATAPQGQTQRR